MLNSARITDLLLSITAQTSLEKHPISSRTDNRFGEEGGAFTVVERPKREADHYFQTVLRSTMRQFVPPGLLQVFSY